MCVCDWECVGDFLRLVPPALKDNARNCFYYSVAKNLCQTLFSRVWNFLDMGVGVFIVCIDGGARYHIVSISIYTLGRIPTQFTGIKSALWATTAPDVCACLLSFCTKIIVDFRWIFYIVHSFYLKMININDLIELGVCDRCMMGVYRYLD